MVGLAALFALAVCALALVVAPAVQAAPIPCAVDDLKAAITAANSNPDATTIELAAGCTYTLTTVDNDTDGHGPNGLPTVSTPITLDGNGATLRRDPAAPNLRFLYVTTGGSLDAQDLTLTEGTVAAAGSQGGAVRSDCDGPATLIFRRVAFVGNGAGAGGAVFSCGQLTVEQSLFRGNAAGNGGALRIFGGGGTVQDSTFVGNVADQLNAGAVNVDLGIAFTLRHTTIAGNSAAGSGGGVSGAILQNTILASNTPNNCFAPIDEQGGNNVSFPASDTSCQSAEVTGPATYLTGDPMLQPLGSYGGPTASMRPLAGSAAVDAIGAAGENCTAADQRGVARPIGAGCDSGAVEAEQDPPSCGDVSSSGPFGAVQQVALACSDPNGYPLVLSAVAGPGNGALGVFGSSSVSYTPIPGFSGADTFTYKATNGFASDSATARLSVGAPPPTQPPTQPAAGPPTGRCFGRRATILVAAGGKTIRGTSGNDVIVATRGPDRIVSGRGRDVVCSRGGDDTVTTGSGDDRVSAGPGADVVSTGGGNDIVNPGSGPDRVNTGAGNDRLGLAGNSRDRANCGRGRDRATGDLPDRLRGCERVRRVRQRG